ncbi:hypothetical protein M5689_020837 [Euphorbia peplus]|nr:hypothetical protein M5689_020837 [Euphorbia peplus]
MRNNAATFMNMLKPCRDLMVAKLSPYLNKEWVTKCTLDSILKVVFGVAFDNMCRLNEARKTTFLKGRIFNFVTAGKDTIKVIFSWFIYVLYQHSVVHGKELAANIEEEAIGKMNYILVALIATLRFYPLVLADEVCLSNHSLSECFSVRQGNGLAYKSYAFDRMKFLWGDDANKYNPERWLHTTCLFRLQNPFDFTIFQLRIPWKRMSAWMPLRRTKQWEIPGSLISGQVQFTVLFTLLGTRML